MKLTYVVVFEQTHNSYSAYPPDLPGCISAGDTWQDIQAMVREAIALYIEEVVESGGPLPEPRMSLEEAMAYHCNALTEHAEELRGVYGDAPPTLSTTFGTVEVEVSLPAARAG